VVHCDAILGHHIAALHPGLPQAGPQSALAGLVHVTDDIGKDRAGDLNGVVKRHLAKDVVHDVRVVDVVQPPVEGCTEVAVNGAQGTTDEVPFVSTVVGKADVGVLEVGDEHKPEIHPHVWGQVVAPHRQESKVVDGSTHGSEDGENAEVGNDDVVVLVATELRGSGVEVGGEASVVLTSSVPQNVPGPPDGEGDHHPEEGDNGALFDNLLQNRLLLVRDEDSVLSEVAGVLVVVAVRDAPAVVWDEHRGVEDQTDGIVHGAPRAEGLMAALVRHHPNTSAVEALHEPEGIPDNSAGNPVHHRCDSGAKAHAGNKAVDGSDGGLTKVHHDVHRDSNLGQVASNVERAPADAAVKVLLRDLALNVAHGECRWGDEHLVLLRATGAQPLHLRRAFGPNGRCLVDVLAVSLLGGGGCLYRGHRSNGLYKVCALLCYQD
jgi:hypothetical protein